MRQAALYIRVSTTDQAQNGYSIDAQKHILTSWCREHNIEIFGLYQDGGISGKDITHRPALCELLTAVKTRQIDIVIVWALSRLTRSVCDLYAIWSQLSANDTDLISHTEPFDTSTPVGRAMMGMLGVFAQMEREITGERTKAAMCERAMQGKRTTNQVLGYDLDGANSLKINEAEAKQVQYIYSHYIKCHSLSAVAKLCKLNGYRGKRGKALKAESIKRILTRPIYIGYNSYHNQLYPGNHEPIISLHDFNIVQKLLKRPVIHPNKKGG